MRNYVQYSENLDGFPTFFIFLSLMLSFGSMALQKLECMRGVERRKLKRVLEAGSKSLHAVFLQFGQLYLSRAVECISRGLNILRGGTQLNWRGRDISTNENFLLVTNHQLLSHAVFFKIGQLYFSQAIEIISHRLGSILVKRKVKPKLNWTTWGVLPSLRMKSLFK